MRDLHNNISVVQVFNPATRTAATTSAEIDAQGYNSLTVVFAVGLSGDTLSGSVYWTLKLTECDTSGGTFTDVAAADIIGSTNIVIDSSSEDETAYKIGYKGSKRFVKGVATPTGTHTNGTPIGIVALKGHASLNPAA